MKGNQNNPIQPKTKTDLRGHLPPEGEKTESWEHQRAAFHFSYERSFTMLYMDMGTGKSKVVVDLACVYARKRSRRLPYRVLVVCPKAVMPVWPSQFEAHRHEDIDTLVLQPRGSVKQKAREVVGFLAESSTRLDPPDLQVVVVNYESARGGLLGWDKRTQKAGVLLQYHWDLVVLDESHRAKKPSGPTSLFTRRLREKSTRRLCLTGTPMPNGPLGLWNQFLFLDPRVLGTSFVRFRSEHAIMGGPTGQWVQGYKNFERLGGLVGPHVFYCDDSVVDLPELTYSNRYCDLSVPEKKAYRDMEDDFITEVRGGVVTASNALSKLLRLQQITSGFLPSPGGPTEPEARIGTTKINLLEDVLDDIGPDEPVVVFCRFRLDLQAVRAAFERKGRTVVELSGSRNDIGARWDGPKNSAVVQIQSGNLGVDLTRARYTIFFAPTFSYGDYKQAIKRTHRPGQERPCSVIHLVARDTVDERVYAALSQKEDVVRAVLNSFQGDS